MKNKPLKKFISFDEYGKKIKEDDRSINKIIGVSNIGTTVFLYAKVGSGDKEETRVIKAEDPEILRQIQEVSNSQMLQDAIAYSGVSVVSEQPVITHLFKSTYLSSITSPNEAV